MTPGRAAALHPGGAAAAVRACRRRVRRGWARHLRWHAPTFAVAMESCKAHATCLPTPDDHRSSLQRKAHGPRGSVEGRLRVHMAVLIGCQMAADWHARRRLIARIVTTSRGDGTVTRHRWAARRVEGGKRREKTAHASSPPVLTTAHASSTYTLCSTGSVPAIVLRFITVSRLLNLAATGRKFSDSL